MKHEFLGRKISVRHPGGNASKKSVRADMGIPLEIVEMMDIKKDDRFVITYDEEKKEFTVRKETVEDCII